MAAGTERPAQWGSGPTVRSELTARRVFSLLVIGSLLLLAAVARPFAVILFLGAVFAGALHPLHRRLTTRLRGHSKLSALVIVIASAGAVIAPMGWLTAYAAHEAIDGYRYVSETVQSEGMNGLIAKLPDRIEAPARRVMERLHIDPEHLAETTSAQGSHVAQVAAGAAARTGSVVLQTALMLIALYFFLLDGARLVVWLERISPLKPGQAVELFSEFRKVSVAVLVSSVATAAVQAVVATLGYVIARVPHPVFFGVLTFFLALIPAIGAASVSVVAALLLLATGHLYAAIFLAIWGLGVVGLVDNVVKPALVKRGLSLHGAVVFFALLGGLAAFGPVGLLIGPMAVAFFVSLVRIYNRDYGARLPPQRRDEPAPPSPPAPAAQAMEEEAAEEAAKDTERAPEPH